jgi:anti-sigma factor RsiW
LSSSLTCKQFIEFLDDYVAHVQPPEMRDEFERHLSICPDCVNYLVSYRMTVRLARSAGCADGAAPPAEVPKELIDAILAARAKGSP